MSYNNVLVTGGAGFVGSNLAIMLKQDSPDTNVIVLDNLKRRGSEFALTRLANRDVKFVHGDIRNPEDIKTITPFDLMIECSAEASVHAGYDIDPSYLINTNLFGTINCLNAAKANNADIVFLSTNRVYPIAHLRNLPYQVSNRRFLVPEQHCGLGWSNKGINESFPMDGSRSLYGATKLASELLLTEFSEMYGLRAIINRCGVITGPWQLGMVDQGFIALWAARHLFSGPLSYIGYGGLGQQVRDVLHVQDLYNLIRLQLKNMNDLQGLTLNVGGGPDSAVSLQELTKLCQNYSSNILEIGSEPETRPADIPWYITDIHKVNSLVGWKPTYSLDDIVDDVFSWLTDNRNLLEPFFSH